MTGLEHATPVALIILAGSFTAVIYYIKQAKSAAAFVRKIPGIKAIDEACGRAAELGRPIIFTSGLTGISPVLYACLGVLYHITRKAARLKHKLLLPQCAPDVLAITDEVARDAYRIEGRLSQYDPRNTIYLSDEQFAFAAGYIGLVQREQVGSAFLFGQFAAESLVLAEAGQQVGAMQVAGTISPEQVAFFITSCDYTLIGEELFAASAYLTREPVQLGSLLAQDRIKLFFFYMILLGSLIATFNAIFPTSLIPNLEKLIYWRAW